MSKKRNRLYKDLAWLWPLWEDVKIYRPESEQFIRLIKKFSKIKIRTLLDIGCGGGKNDFHLKRHFEVTGIDKSDAMLNNARKLNSECEYFRRDMRSFDLKQQFDAVFINDAVTYMKTEDELLKVFRMAYKHLKAGGVMICYPDRCKERFKQNETTVWASKHKSLDLTFIENNYDPNPKDQNYETTFIYLIRDRGKLRIEQDFHICGLFGMEVWKKLLRRAGFEIVKEEDDDSGEVPVFACIKHK